MEYSLGNAWIWEAVEQHILRGAGLLFVLGPQGIGKTHTVKEICIHHNIDVYYVDSYNCGSSKELLDILQKQSSTRFVQALSQVRSRKVIVVDELEGLLQFDRSMLSTIMAFKDHQMPIVCIGHKQLEKKLQQQVSDKVILVCSAPSEQDICIWLKRHAGKHLTCGEILDVAQRCEGNITTAMQMLHKNTCSKDAPFTFQDIYSNVRPDDVFTLLEDDPWLTPLKYHENLPRELTDRKGTKDTKERFYAHALECMLDWDIMMQHEQCTTFALERVASSVRGLTHLPRKKGRKTDDKGLNEFTKLFSNLSLHKKNERKLYPSYLGFPWIHAQIFCDYIKYR